MSARLQRLAALTAVWASLELLERIAYRAGVTDAAAAAGQTLADFRHRPLDNPGPGDEPWWCQVCGGPCENVDDLEAADVGDVLAEHIGCDCCTGAPA